MITTAKRDKEARAQADIARWRRDLAYAEQNGATDIADMIRRWIDTRERLLADLR